MQDHDVSIHKVKGHADNPNNNRCDELATGQIKRYAKPKDASQVRE